MERAHPVQTICRLDLGRRDSHGAWRRAGNQRSPLCGRGQQAATGCAGRRESTARSRAGRPVGRALMKFAAPLGVFVVLSAFLTAGLRLDPHHVPSPLIDRPAPSFRLAHLDDPEKTFTPADMLGRVWLLNVWA